jgi:hypothetical protein
MMLPRPAFTPDPLKRKLFDWSDRWIGIRGRTVGPAARPRESPAAKAGPEFSNSARREYPGPPSATRTAGTICHASDTNHGEGLSGNQIGHASPAPRDGGRTSDASPAPTPAAEPRPGPPPG